MRHPFFYALVRLRARTELRRKGYRFGEINEIMGGGIDEVIDLAEAQARESGDQNPSGWGEIDKFGPGAIGDGNSARC